MRKAFLVLMATFGLFAATVTTRADDDDDDDDLVNPRVGRVDGKVVSVTDTIVTITIGKKMPKERIFVIDAKTHFIVDRVPGKASELKPGQRVSVTSFVDTALWVEARPVDDDDEDDDEEVADVRPDDDENDDPPAKIGED